MKKLFLTAVVLVLAACGKVPVPPANTGDDFAKRLEQWENDPANKGKVPPSQPMPDVPRPSGP